MEPSELNTDAASDEEEPLTELNEKIEPEDNENMDAHVDEQVEVIGVRFKVTGKTYYFAPNGITSSVGDHLIVETARGIEFGETAIGNKNVPASEIVPPLRPVVRKATPEDEIRNEKNKQKELEAFNICAKKIADHNLDMKLVEVEYTFDNSKLLFYFTADGRIDFRDLVKDLASVFRTRIELRQIGIRDEAKMLGGLGICGRPFCCKSFLPDFVQVSIKMAKEQNMSLNSAKISGTCGRLMCCLRYEHEVYEEAIRKSPKVDSTVKTPDGNGTVCEVSPLAGIVKVMLDNEDKTVKSYHCDQLQLIRPAARKEAKEDNDADDDVPVSE